MFPISEHDARRAYAKSTGKYQEKKPTRILLLGDGRGGAASNIIAPGGRNYVWAREGGSANARYFPILNLGSVQPAADLRVMVGYDPLSQYPNEEQILGSYTTDTVGIGVRVTNNSDTSAADATARLLSFNTERFNSGSMHSTTSKTSRLVATAPGIYLINLGVTFAFNVNGSRRVQIRLNANESATAGSRIAFSTQTAVPTSNINHAMNLTTFRQLTVGDYVEAFVSHNAGGSNLLVLSLDEESPEFSMVRIEQNLV